MLKTTSEIGVICLRRNMEDKILIAIVGGFIGGVLGVVGTIVSSYFGPRKLEEWREARNSEK